MKVIMNRLKTKGLDLHMTLIYLLLICPFSAYSLDTACDHVTDRNTTVTVTQIRYDHKFYIRIALASEYEYQSSLEDASSSRYRTLAIEIEDEVESHLETSRGDSLTFYDVVVVRFISITSSPPSMITNLPDDITLQADIIVSTSNDGVRPGDLRTLLQDSLMPDISTLFYVITISETVDVCLREVLHTSQGTLTFPVTEVGISQGTEERCPVGFERAGELSVAVRTCSRKTDSPGHAAWAQFMCSDCGSITQEGELLELSEQITNAMENDPNLVVIRDAIDLLRDSGDITSVGILAIAEILEALAKTGNVSIEVLQEVGTLLSLALDVDTSILVEAETLYFSSSRINRALESILAITHLNDRLDFTTTSTKVVLGIRRLEQGSLNFNWYGLRLDADQPNSGSESSLLFDENPTLMYDEDSTASLHFQFGDLPAPGQSDVRLTYKIYPMDKLFHTVTGQEVVANGWVMSIHLAGVRGQVRSTVTTTSRPTVQTVEPSACGYWNDSINGGHGGWIQDGCQLSEMLSGDLIVCQCESRGTFALIKDAAAEPFVYPRLHAIVFIGAVIAFLGALSCFLVLICVKKLRKRQLYRIEAAFCLPVAIFYLVFAAGQSAPSMITGCAVAAGILHYFILVSTCTMVAVAAKFYDTSRLKAVASKWFVLNTVAPSWGVPLLVVCLTLAPAPIVFQNSVPRCFLNGSNPYALIFALLLPMVACLIVTAVIFFLTNRNIIKQPTSTSGSHEGAKTPWAWLTTGRISQMTFIFILCYVTWLFLLSVVYSVLAELQYIFGVFAIVQGVAFPVVLCILDEEVKYAMMAVFGKGKDSTRSFQPYFSASHWHPNPDIIPQDAPKQFLDNTQRNSTLTRQNFNPTVIPLSDTEQRRISKADNGFVNPIAEQSGEEIEMTSLKAIQTQDFSAYEEPIGSLSPSPVIRKDRTDSDNGPMNHIAVEAQIEFR
nr:adhesion G-protein coupled receptor G6-like [Lytechinus pictus]